MKHKITIDLVLSKENEFVEVNIDNHLNELKETERCIAFFAISNYFESLYSYDNKFIDFKSDVVN